MNKLERAYKIWLDDRFSEKVVVKSFVCLYMEIDFADYDVNVSDECVWVRVCENMAGVISYHSIRC